MPRQTRAKHLQKPHTHSNPGSRLNWGPWSCPTMPARLVSFDIYLIDCSLFINFNTTSNFLTHSICKQIQKQIK